MADTKKNGNCGAPPPGFILGACMDTSRMREFYTFRFRLDVNRSRCAAVAK